MLCYMIRAAAAAAGEKQDDGSKLLDEQPASEPAPEPAPEPTVSFEGWPSNFSWEDDGAVRC